MEIRKKYTLFGNIINSRVNLNDQYIISVNNWCIGGKVASDIDREVWRALPTTFDINLTHTINSSAERQFPFSNHRQGTESVKALFPSWENGFLWEHEADLVDNSGINRKYLKDKLNNDAIVAFSITVGYYSRGLISGFQVDDVLSVDLWEDIKFETSKVLLSGRAASTTLPIFNYLRMVTENHYKCGVNSPLSAEHINEVEKLKSSFSFQFCIDGVHPYAALKNVKPCSYEFYKGATIIEVATSQEYRNKILTTKNLKFIFDKFYYNISEYGRLKEYSYGERIYYYIDDNGDIVHRFSENKLPARDSDTSSKNSVKETVILRLGDKLTDEMIAYLEEPVKGHYKPTILFDEV